MPTGSLWLGVPKSEFDAETSAKTFHDVMVGHRNFGPKKEKKETIVINLVTQHCGHQRQLIRKKYQDLYHKDLAEELRKHFGGNFSKTVYGLMLHPAEFLATQIYNCVHGAGTDERRLIGLLVTRTNVELHKMKGYYRERYGKEMEDRVADDLSWDFRDLLVAIMRATRNEYDHVEPDRVRVDAKTLYGVREADLGSREEFFKIIFTSRSPSHMRRVFYTYQQIAGGQLTIEDTIKASFEGDLKNTYLAMVKSFQGLVAYNAERLHKSMAGLGTDDDTLMEILISRAEIDLEDIAACYEVKYRKKLVKAVIGDTSGYYRTLLTRLIEGSKD